MVTASINICAISASIGGSQFYTSTILSIGQAIDWNTALTQTDVPNAQGSFSVSVNCPIGGIAAIYVDSIFMSNQVTPETIDTVSIDFGDEGSIVSSTEASSPPATSAVSNEASPEAATHAVPTESQPLGDTSSRPATLEPSTATEPFSAIYTPSSDTEPATKKPSTATELYSATYDPTSATEPAVSGVSTSIDINTFSPSTEVWSGSQTLTYSSASAPTQESTSKDGPSTMSGPATHDPTTETDSDIKTLTWNPTTDTVHGPATETYSPATTESSSPSGSRVCPAGAPPPRYCTPVQPQATQMVSLPGHQETFDGENDGLIVPRVCWAYGVPKTGMWGRVKSYKPRQNSIEDCALLCKQEGSSCKGFALNTFDEELSCWFVNDRLAIT